MKFIPLTPHFYIEKLGYLFFLFLLQNIDCGYSLEPPLQSNVLSKNIKNIKFFPMKFSIFAFEKKNLCILHGHVFVMHATFFTHVYLLLPTVTNLAARFRIYQTFIMRAPNRATILKSRSHQAFIGSFSHILGTRPDMTISVDFGANRNSNKQTNGFRLTGFAVTYLGLTLHLVTAVG